MLDTILEVLELLMISFLYLVSMEGFFYLCNIDYVSKSKKDNFYYSQCKKTPYNLCTPFKHDIRCASLCGVKFVVTKERRGKRAQFESSLKGVRSLEDAR